MRPRYGGIRYISRLGNVECWEIFEGADLELVDENPHAGEDGDLLAVTELYAIKLG